MIRRIPRLVRVAGVAGVALVLVAGCDGDPSMADDIPPHSTVAPAPATAAESQAPPLGEAVTVDYGNELLGWGELLSRPDIWTLRANFVSVDEDALVVDVLDDLTGRGVATGEATLSIGELAGIADASDFTAVAAERGGQLPMLIVADDHRNILHTIELDGSGRGFETPRIDDDSPRLGPDNLWMSRALASGEYVKTLLDPIDPNLSIFCQDTYSVTTVPFEPGADLVADWVAFAIEAHEAAESQVGPAARLALVDRADRVASQIAGRDPVTGRGTSVWNTDVIDQALRGVPEEEWELIPTVPVFVEPGLLTWSEGRMSGLVFAEAGSGRILGWTAYSGYADLESPLETETLEVMTPPTGGDVEIHVVEENNRIGCLEGVGPPLMVIPFDDIAGSGRAIIDLDTATYEPWEATDG